MKRNELEAKENVEFTLFENGLDSLAKGLELISSASNKSELKQAILNLAAGIEQVLKARLAQEDWRLLFHDPDSADPKIYYDGKFRSIGFEKCIERLDDYCDLTLSEKEKMSLSSFREKRHKLEHFSIRESWQSVEASAVEALGVLLDFVGKAFDFDSIGEAEKRLMEKIQSTLNEFRAYTRKRLAEIEGGIDKIRRESGCVIECPHCLQLALATDVRVKCLFCGYADDAERAAEYFSNAYECPNCENVALVDRGITGGQCPSIEYECFACGWHWMEGEARMCWDCGQPKEQESFWGDRCSSCDRAYMARDNT
jgi:hypothetical protein